MEPWTDVLGVIPARWASTRFPGKPLALLNGRPMVLHVWDRCREAGLGRIVVATDDDRILRVCQEAGAEAVMTDPDLPSGTDRCAAVAREASESLVINVQGDEPFVAPQAIRELVGLLRDRTDCPIATLARAESDPERLRSPHVVKVVTDARDRALYFSRAWIPFQRDMVPENWPDRYMYLSHVGLYGFRKDVLRTLSGLPVHPLEEAEKLEQLRWLANGYSMVVGLTTYQSLGIDTPEDLEHAQTLFKKS